ncbi:DUF2971 domain-containing protein [Dyadobacter sp. Leaf189]|uniref:DUF2971 domain-containing protein n=1 Tax=Dyadobacter sp. Leaf189 TaxID=1736295 RepID=UPI0006F41B66|nr:DUF2971 domain-containing protein [Dyadobacter sp. Leaf189]KQS32729.1 hypothetical protein ASG33_01030 [Dyadobacter sp. Leaf189]
MDDLPEWQKLMLNALAAGKFEDAVEFKKPYLPKKLYKYREITLATLDNIVENRLWASTPASFNDPYDSGVGIIKNSLHRQDTYWTNWLEEKSIGQYIADEDLKSIFDSSNRLEALERHIRLKYPIAPPIIYDLINMRHQIEKIVLDLNRRCKESINVCSFSAVNDSFLLWAHYANDHKGICVEYDLPNYQPHDMDGRRLFPVIYSSELFDASDFEQSKYLPLIASIYKHSDWSYEQEWRYIDIINPLSPGRYFYLNKCSAIYFGSRTTLDQIDTTFRLTKIAHNVMSYRMINDNTKFGLSAKSTSELGIL